MITRFREWLKKRKSIRKYAKIFKQAEKAGFTDKYGLTGTHGLIPGTGHVSMPFSRGHKDTVFVEADEEILGRSWDRMHVREAKAHKEKIIPCHYCANPAVSLDHGHPYQTERNACEEHLKTFDESLQRKK